MNIAVEKEAIIKQFNKVHDEALIRAIKNLLDFGLSRQANNDETLEEAMKLSINQSDKRQVIPHEEVMADIRKRYTA